MLDPHDEFQGFCEKATDKQLPAIYWKERDSERPLFAIIAKAVAASRGISVLERVEWRED